MTVNTQDRQKDFVAQGAAATVAINFPFARASDLIVVPVDADGVEGAPLTLNSHYSIGGDGRTLAGVLTEINLNVGADYRIRRKTALAQSYNPKMGVAGDASAMENQLDDTVMATIDLAGDSKDLSERAVKVSTGATAPTLDIGGLVDGDLLEYRSGKLRRADFLGSAGLWAVFDSLGHLMGASALDPDIVPALAVNIGADGGSNVQAELDIRAKVADLLSTDAGKGSEMIAFIHAGLNAIGRSALEKMRDSRSVKDYGAVGDARVVNNGAMTNGQATLTSATAGFTSDDVGKLVSVANAVSSGVALVSTIVAVNSATQVVLDDAATNTVSGANVVYGTDDTDAIQNALNELSLGGRMDFPHGGYCTSDRLTCFIPGAELVGQGAPDTETRYVVGSVIYKFGNHDGIVCSGYNVRVHNLSVMGPVRAKGSGAGTGTGIVIAGRGCAVDRVVARYNGARGVEVNAKDASGTDDVENSHWVQLTNGFTEYNGEDGVAFDSPNSGKMNMNLVLNWTSRHNDGDGYHNAAGSYMLYILADAEYNLGKGMRFLKGSYSALLACHTEQNEGGDGSVDRGDGVWIEDGVIQVAFFAGTYGEGGGGSDFQAGIGYASGATQQDRDIRVLGDFFKDKHITPTSNALGLRDLHYKARNWRPVASAAAGYAAIVTPAAGLELSGAFYGIRTSATTMEARIAVGKNGTDQEKGGVDVARFSLAEWAPAADNTFSLGTASLRFKEIFSANATINTSDDREKEQVSDIPDEWLDIWGEVEWSRYKWQAAVAEKGDEARWHVGLVAQQVRDIFASHDVDASEIGLLCHDEWDDVIEESEVLDEDGKPTGEVLTRVVRESGDRWGLRYQEANAFEAAWQRREIERMRQEIELLQASNG